MSNWQFMWLFPEERNLLAGVITGVREKVGLAKSEDELADYQSRFGNLQETMRQIRDAHPEEVRAVLKDMTTRYNHSVDQAVARFPLTVDSYWQNYRRNLSKGSIVHGLSTDEEMANFRKEFTAETIGLEGGISLDVEPQYQLLDRQQQRVLGVGVYIFKREDGSPIETIWDLRQKETPRFQDTK